MTPLRRLLPALLWWPLSAVLLLSPGGGDLLAPERLARFVDAGGDKAVHLLLFAGLAWSLARGLGERTLAARQTWLACVAWAATTELLQARVPYRSPELLDFAADLAGASLAVLVWRARKGKGRQEPV